MDFKLYNLFKQCINWLIPAKCVACDIELDYAETHFCNDCRDSLPYSGHSCMQCGQIFSADGLFCGACIATPPAFDRCFCAFEYKHPIDKNICKLKYGNHPQSAKTLATLFAAEAVAHEIELPDALIPVPMHPAQLKQRGFNQSLELAKHFSRYFSIPLIQGAIAKDKETPQQASQTLKQRKHNLRSCFTLKKKIKQKHIAIVDDVVTTGTTAEEIAKILKKNGVDYVQVWGIARTR